MLFLYPKSSTELLISMFTRAFKATVQSGAKTIHKLLPTGMITSYLLSSDPPPHTHTSCCIRTEL